MELLFVVVPLALIIGSILGIVSFFKFSDLNKRLQDIERKLEQSSPESVETKPPAPKSDVTHKPGQSLKHETTPGNVNLLNPLQQVKLPTQIMPS